MFTALGRVSGGEDAAMELRCCIVSPYSELVTADPQALPTGSASSSSPRSCFSSSCSKTSSLAVADLATGPLARSGSHGGVVTAPEAGKKGAAAGEHHGEQSAWRSGGKEEEVSACSGRPRHGPPRHRLGLRGRHGHHLPLQLRLRRLLLVLHRRHHHAWRGEGNFMVGAWIRSWEARKVRSERGRGRQGSSRRRCDEVRVVGEEAARVDKVGGEAKADEPREMLERRGRNKEEES